MDASTLDLARLQFALTAGAHFLFVALTLGLATFVAAIQTRATFSGDPMHLRMTRFWGQLYVINYAVGIVTGIVMEFQFGMDWSGLSHFAGNTFGSTLALETVIAFFLEATFLGLWIFGWGRLNRWVHLATIWIVTLTAYASAYFILVTNGFLHDPAGYAQHGASLRLTDPAALLTNPNAIVAFLHIAGGALLTGAFFMSGVAAYHLFRRTAEHRLFTASLRIGVFTALPATLFTATAGGFQFAVVGRNQPMKMAVFDGAPARIAQQQAAAAARYGPGDYVPPELWVRLGGILMLVAFALMLYLALGNVLLAPFRTVVLRFRLWHLLLIASVPLPYVAMISGWVFRETGRQPWTVYGLLRTADAVSPLSDAAMRTSLLTFSTLFGVIALINIWLLIRYARRDPAEVGLGAAPPAEPAPLPVATY